MSTGIGCEILLDGVHLADGRLADDDELEPTALSGLHITWGRTTTLDQPEPATCEFEVMDLPGGEGFLTRLRTGRRVDVVAAGTLYPDPDTPTFTDPDFTDTPPGSTPPSAATNATVTITPDATALLIPEDASHPGKVVFAPAPFSPLPNAWDEIPATVPGQEWVLAATIRAPAGALLRLAPAYFARPAGTFTTTEEETAEIATGHWQELTLTVTPQTTGTWVGVGVTLEALPAWDDQVTSWADTPGSWLDYASAQIDHLTVLAPTGGILRSVAVFSGRITDLDPARWDDTFQGVRIHVTAADFTADLENDFIGDVPWAVEPMGDRFRRILDLSSHDVNALIDDTVADIPVSYQDVDNRAVGGLLQDLAVSVDGILWAATHQTTGPYLHLEDPRNRTALYTLAELDGLVVIIPAGALAAAQDISACDVLRDPVEWAQTVSDVSTRVAVIWLEQGVDEEGRPETTERTLTVVDTALEAEYGTRRISLTTMLASAIPARQVADRILARTSFTGWRARGLTIDDARSLSFIDAAAIQMMLRLLDGTTRIGLPIRLTDLPDWAPVRGLLPVYLEGGTYRFVDGAWILELTVSQAALQGASPPWMNLQPHWAWTGFDPTISWLDLSGVAYPPPPEPIIALPAPIGDPA